MKYKDYPDIGRVFYKKSSKVKRLILKITSQGEVHVTYPPYTLLYIVEKFVLSKSEWILNKLQNIQTSLQNQAYLDDFPNITSTHNLRFISLPSELNTVKYRIVDNEIVVFVSENIDKSNSIVQATIKKGIEHVYKNQAVSYIPIRVKELAASLNFSYSTVRISSAKTRWGSCSAKNGISISFHIMKLPSHLIDFIIIHELCHIIHKNHSEKFHKLLDVCLKGKKKEYEKELKKVFII